MEMQDPELPPPVLPHSHLKCPTPNNIYNAGDLKRVQGDARNNFENRGRI